MPTATDTLVKVEARFSEALSCCRDGPGAQRIERAEEAETLDQFAHERITGTYRSVFSLRRWSESACFGAHQPALLSVVTRFALFKLLV